jgi:two-component sensor histidine kinase
MQVITSLLHLEAANKSDTPKDVAHLFQNSQNRINAMALVHETLYQSDDVSTIAIAPYIQDLVNFLYENLKQPHHNIEFDLQIPDVHFGLDTAIPLGLLLNEILSNSLVHGLAEQTEGKIHIHIVPLLNDDYQLLIGDNGKGMEAFKTMLRKRSLGLSLIKKLVRQLQGSINTVKTTDGCHYDINFHAVY